MEYLLKIPGILAAVTLHEFIKALASACQGDILPKRDKRVTLNPVKHFEPVGFFLFVCFGYGWGRPVRTSALNYKNRKRGTVLTHALPIVANLLAALALCALYPYIPRGFMDLTFLRIPYIQILLSSVIWMNIAMALFNLVPVYPMDMFEILKVTASSQTRQKLLQHQRTGQLIMLLGLLLGLNLVLDHIVRGIMLLFSIPGTL